MTKGNKAKSREKTAYEYREKTAFEYEKAWKGLCIGAGVVVLAVVCFGIYKNLPSTYVQAVTLEIPEYTLVEEPVVEVVEDTETEKIIASVIPETPACIVISGVDGIREKDFTPFMDCEFEFLNFKTDASYVCYKSSTKCSKIIWPTIEEVEDERS